VRALETLPVPAVGALSWAEKVTLAIAARSAAVQVSPPVLAVQELLEENASCVGNVTAS
jgi:hypothetical protein